MTIYINVKHLQIVNLFTHVDVKKSFKLRPVYDHELDFVYMGANFSWEMKTQKIVVALNLPSLTKETVIFVNMMNINGFACGSQKKHHFPQHIKNFQEYQNITISVAFLGEK